MAERSCNASEVHVCSDAGMAGGKSLSVLTATILLTVAVLLLATPAAAAAGHRHRTLLQGGYGSMPAAAQPGAVKCLCSLYVLCRCGFWGCQSVYHSVAEL
jgi:hypothetical protein